MFPEWLVPCCGIYAQLVATRIGQTMKFEQCAEERMAVVRVQSFVKALLVAEE